MKGNKKIKRLIAVFLTVISLVGLLSLGAAAEEARPQLIPGGVPFGVRFVTDGILIVGFCDVESGGRAQNPARDAGLKIGDRICRVNGAGVTTAGDLAGSVAENGGKPLRLDCCGERGEFSITLTPLACDKDGRFRTGLWVRDSGAGIGTVTFVVPEKNQFAGLGHGICDAGSGELIPLSRGSVMGVTIGSVVKGAAGAPGELRGHFSSGKIGTLFQNTVCGVFGVFTEPPSLPLSAMPIGYRHELHDGEATVWCTLDDNAPRAYRVEIGSINHRADGNKCFTVKVTDSALLQKSGGIVQGMSGSPIIQDGRLVGAVTHVLIGDPTTGYGIFIENMLANMPQALG